MMLQLDNAPMRAIRLALLVGALIFSASAWADPGVTDPNPCPILEDEEGNPVLDEEGNPISTAPIADSKGGDSSFAAGCGADANGDGSVAIGHNASTELFEVGEERIVANGTLTVDGQSVDVLVEYDDLGEEIGYYYKDTNGDGMVDVGDMPAESLAAIVRELDPNKEDDLVPDHTLTVEGTRRESFEEVVPVENAVAIGRGATVKGDGGIALGSGATVGRDGKVTTTREMEEIDKRIVAEGTLTVEDVKPIEIFVEYDPEEQDQVIGYYRKDKLEDNNGDGTVDVNDVPGAEAETLAAIIHDLDPNKDDNLVPTHSLVVQGTEEVTITKEHVTMSVVDDIPATNGIAIGNGAAVMGDNGIAIGAGAAVMGDNGIAIGAGVEAGENQIVIGRSDHSAIIAGVDIKQARADIDTNATGIMANAAGIMANTGRITANESNIMDNASAIAGNAAAIADFNDQLMGVDERVKQVAAMSAALSAVPNMVSGDGDFFLGVGFGNSSGEQGIAVGVSARFGPKKNIVFNAGAASAGDETSARVGVGFVW